MGFHLLPLLYLFTSSITYNRYTVCQTVWGLTSVINVVSSQMKKVCSTELNLLRLVVYRLTRSTKKTRTWRNYLCQYL